MIQTLRRTDPGLYRFRRDTLVDELRQPVLIFGMGSALGAGSKSHGALRYLTGWDGHESMTLFILTKNVARLICASPFMAPLAAEALPELDPVYLPPDRWAGLIRDHIPAGTVELIGLDELPMGIARHLHPVIRQDDTASAVLDRMRVIKEPAALDLHRAGAAICDAVFAHLPSVLSVGASVVDAQRDLETFAVSHGADACRMWLTIRPQADRPRYWPEETQGIVAAGDQVLVGIALTVDGHWAHGIRMGAVGPMRPDHARLLDIVAACLRAGLDHARPGLPLTNLVDVMEDAFRTGTSGLDRRDLQRFRFGHGLGMSYEDPILTDAFVQSFGVKASAKRPDGAGGILAPGMVLELHPNLFLPGVGGAALGEMVIIGETGAETPITTPLTPIIVGFDY